MSDLTYSESKKIATKIILILAVITFSEVIFALYGKGHLIDGHSLPGWLIGGVMIAMSIIKAYLIIYEFMHMKYEMSGLSRSVVLPTLLLVWAVIAFFWEGSTWQSRRDRIQDANKKEINTAKTGMIFDHTVKQNAF